METHLLLTRDRSPHSIPTNSMGQTQKIVLQIGKLIKHTTNCSMLKLLSKTISIMLKTSPFITPVEVQLPTILYIKYCQRMKRYVDMYVESETFLNKPSLLYNPHPF